MDNINNVSLGAIGINPDSPDMKFVITENSINEQSPAFQVVEWSSKSNRLKSVGSVQTILGMNEIIDQALRLIKPFQPEYKYTKMEDNQLKYYSDEDLILEGDPGIYFAPDFPAFLMPKTSECYEAAPHAVPRVLTWTTVRKEPGTMSGTPFRGTQEIKPRHREYIAIISDTDKKYFDYNTPGTISNVVESFGGLVKLVNIKAQAFDNMVQYNLWCRSNYEVEEFTEWFESFMDDYRGMIREAGIVESYFMRRVRDDTLMAMNNGYHVRSVLYYFRTERIGFETFGPINRINLNVSKSNISSIISRLDDINANISNNKIVENWVNKLN